MPVEALSLPLPPSLLVFMVDLEALRREALFTAFDYFLVDRIDSKKDTKLKESIVLYTYRKLLAR